ncbi:MAG TPA: type IV pilus assembly protein PilM [Fimbriimonas sp.]|nr:type IV pilus assembly protein PilM [Fimbriimonas sp.]
MASKLSSVLGIDIGSHSIKVCEIKASGKGATVSAVWVAPTPEGTVDYSGVYNSDAIGTALKQIISQSGASSGSAVVSIAGQQSVLVRVIEVPRAEDEKAMKAHMEWEINKNIPFAESNIMSDFKVIPSDNASSDNVDVVMAMAPQSAIDTIVECIKKSGKKPVAIDVEPLGIARSIATSYPEIGEAGGGLVVVDIGHSTTSINVYERNNLVLPRPVPGGGEMITRAIADAMQVGMEEAETYKNSKFAVPADATPGGYNDPFSMGTSTQAFDPGFSPYSAAPDPVAPAEVTSALDIDPVTGLPIVAQESAEYMNDPFATSTPAPEPTVSIPAPSTFTPAPVAATDHVFSAVQGILDDLVAELRRSIDYYNGRGGTVSKIVLCGGGARLNGLASYIQRSLGTDCEVYDPMRNLGFSSKKVGMEYLNDHREQLAVAVGNGLHIMFN